MTSPILTLLTSRLRGEKETEWCVKEERDEQSARFESRTRPLKRSGISLSPPPADAGHVRPFPRGLIGPHSANHRAHAPAPGSCDYKRRAGSFNLFREISNCLRARRQHRKAAPISPSTKPTGRRGTLEQKMMRKKTFREAYELHRSPSANRHRKNTRN